MPDVPGAARLIAIPMRAALIATLALSAGVPAFAQPAPPPVAAAPTTGQPTWRQVFETPQTVYYLGQATPAAGPPAGDLAISSMVAFKIPQVLNGAQVWSVISNLRLSCARRQMITRDAGLYAQPMGAGQPISQTFGVDAWHTPEPGSLGELVWKSACAPK